MCGRERRNNEFNCHGLIPEGEIVPEGEIEKIDYEWREVYFLDPGKLPSSSEHRKNIVSFWDSISQMKDTSGECRFPIISKLINSLLSFPHLNAEVEKVFSQVTITKTKLRNSLKSSMLD